MNKCPWCGGEIESGHTEISGVGSGCHTLDIWYTVCASDNFCGYYSVSDEPPNKACTRLETGGVNDAAEKIIQAIEAAQHRVQPTGGTPCRECGMIGGHLWECKLG